MAEEKTFSVGVQTSSPKRISVTSNVSENPITASADTGLYYSQLAKNWAIGEGLIQNEDYSSKTWAAESKSSADLSKMYSEAASLDLNNLENRIIEYDEQLNDTVATGLSEISVLQADSLAEIEANKIGALISIETNLNNATSEINTNRANTLAQISTLANTSISDINATAKSYDNLTHKNITNCLLEVPQRIKYDLTDGTLTIKAGTVVIVPYGTEDLSATYPVGATFLNDNFKVYDTQFADGKFFVWAELMGDIVTAGGANASSTTRVFSISISGNIGLHNTQHFSTSSPNFSQSVQYYNTATNYMCHTNSSGVANPYVLSFPLIYIQANGTYTYGNILNIFNGMGYIGSTIWVDKGVKCLLPDGRNEDETLKNIEYIPPKILIYDVTKSFSAAQSLTLMIENDNTLGVTNSSRCLSGYSLPATVSNTSYHLFYNIRENKHYRTSGSTTANWVEIPKCILGNVYFDGTNLSSFNPKQPFRAVDYNDVDGQWVRKTLTLVSGSSWEVGKNYSDYDLSDYLPKDGNVYEVLFCANGNSGASVNSTILFYIGSEIVERGYNQIFRCKSQANSNAAGGGTAIIPVCANRQINVLVDVGISATGTTYIYALAYRRVGQNI